MCSGGHHARVPEEEVWRTAYPHLSLCAVPLPVCFHQDLSKSPHVNPHCDVLCVNIVPVLLIEMMCFLLSPLRQTCSLAPFLSIRLLG